MPSTTTIRTRIIRAAAIAVAVAGAGLGFTGAPAQAAVGPATGELFITPHKPGYHNVAVEGRIRMYQGEAQQLLNSGYKVQLRLWGEDTFSDDLQLGPYTATAYAGQLGIEFHKVLIGQRDSILDEDWGNDELYAGIRLVKPNGQTVRGGETNRVTGHDFDTAVPYGGSW
jgi:hypothetical protein